MNRILGVVLLIVSLLASPVGEMVTHGPDAAFDLVEVSGHGHSHDADDRSAHDPFDHEHHAEAALVFDDVNIVSIAQTHTTNVVLVLRLSVVDDFPKPPRYL